MACCWSHQVSIAKASFLSAPLISAFDFVNSYVWTPNKSWPVPKFGVFRIHSQTVSEGLQQNLVHSTHSLRFVDCPAETFVAMVKPMPSLRFLLVVFVAIDQIISYCPSYTPVYTSKYSMLISRSREPQPLGLIWQEQPWKRKRAAGFATARSKPHMIRDGGSDKQWLELLIGAANDTIRCSWADMDHFDEGSSSRSASGGTTWADGGWVNASRLAALRDIVESVVLENSNEWRWLQRAPGPVFLPLASGEGFDVTLHVFPGGTVSLPWRMPTGWRQSRPRFPHRHVLRHTAQQRERSPARTNRLRIVCRHVECDAGLDSVKRRGADSDPPLVCPSRRK